MKCNGSSLQGSWWQETPFEKISIANFGFFLTYPFFYQKGTIAWKSRPKTTKCGLNWQNLSASSLGMFYALMRKSAVLIVVFGQNGKNAPRYSIQNYQGRSMKPVKSSFNLSSTQLSFSISSSTYPDSTLELEESVKSVASASSSKLRSLAGGNILVAQKNVRDLLDKYADNETGK